MRTRLVSCFVIDALVAHLFLAELQHDEALHDLGTRISELEQSLDNTKSALSTSEGREAALQAENDSLKAQVESLKSQSQGSDVQHESNRTTLEQSEKEKRELLSLVERLEADKAQLDGGPELDVQACCIADYVYRYSPRPTNIPFSYSCINAPARIKPNIFERF